MSESLLNFLQNLLVDQKLREANEKMKLLHTELKKSQRFSKEAASKDKVFQNDS